MNIIELLQKGIAVTPETYEKMANCHKLEKRVSHAFGRVLEQMGPQDDTPYVLTFGELALEIGSELGIELGN